MGRMTGRASPFHGRLGSCRSGVVGVNVESDVCGWMVYVFPPPVDPSANRQ